MQHTPPANSRRSPLHHGPKDLPDVHCGLSPAQVLERLGTASRRGRLPGYHNHAEPGGVLFTVAAFGHPFDGVVLARAHPANDGTRLAFECRFARRLPVVFALVVLFTIWPGVYFMDQLMIQAAPGWREALPTWWWYLPLTILPLPWLLVTLLRRSRRTVGEAAKQAVERIASEVDGRVVGPDASRDQATPR